MMDVEGALSRVRSTLATTWTTISAGLTEIFALLCIAWLAQFVAFAYFFPGYYRPLVPDNPDFYIPASMHHHGAPFSNLIRYPRPVGSIFLAWIGRWGIEGSVVPIILVSLANCAMTGAICRRVFGYQRRWQYWVAFAVYALAVFSSPNCYYIFRWDVLTQLSYLLLALGVGAFLGFQRFWRALAFIPIFFGFLSKETYGLSLVLLAVAWAFAHYKRSKLEAIFVVAAPILALVLALKIGAVANAPFTGGADSEDSPYRIVLTPASVLSEWLKYAGEFSINLFSGGAVAIAALGALALRPPERRHAVPLLLVVASTLAVVPNSVLPQHHFGGYSWSAAYLLFAALLYFPVLWIRSRRARVVGSLSLILATLSPTLSKDTYASYWWSKAREEEQRKLLSAVRTLTDALGSTPEVRKVLVSGSVGGSPFELGFPLQSFPNVANVQFDVVAYPPHARYESRAGVRYLPPDEIKLTDYDWVWGFRPDNTLALTERAPARVAESMQPLAGFDGRTMLLYPILREMLTENVTQKGLLDCGGYLLSLGHLEGAERCFQQALVLNPGYSWIYFSLGQIREQQGRLTEAADMYQRAVALEPSNPHFLGALGRVKGAGK